MTTLQKMPKSAPQSKRQAIPARERALNAQRQRNRLYAFIVKTLERECVAKSLKRADLAAMLETNPSQISRWLSGPGNWEIDTISDLLLCVGGELEPDFISFDERLCKKSNFNHDVSFAAISTSGPSVQPQALHRPTTSTNKPPQVIQFQGSDYAL